MIQVLALLQAKWNPTPVTTPERPASILSEYGEGYCRLCQFVVGLDAAGRLLEHTRGNYGLGNRECEGGGGVPPRLTPYASRKAAFLVNPPKKRCRECGRRVVVMSNGRFDFHYPPGKSRTGCRGGYTLAGPLEHDGERG